MVARFLHYWGFKDPRDFGDLPNNIQQFMINSWNAMEATGETKHG